MKNRLKTFEKKNFQTALSFKPIEKCEIDVLPLVEKTIARKYSIRKNVNTLDKVSLWGGIIDDYIE